MGNTTCISFDMMIAHTKRTINIDWDNQNKHLTKGYSFLFLVFDLNFTRNLSRNLLASTANRILFILAAMQLSIYSEYGVIDKKCVA